MLFIETFFMKIKNLYFNEISLVGRASFVFLVSLPVFLF